MMTPSSRPLLFALVVGSVALFGPSVHEAAPADQPVLRGHAARSAERFLLMAQTDPAASLDLAVETPMLPRERQRILAAILSEVAAKDPPAALALLDQAAGINRSQARKAIATSWAQHHPADAFAWAVSLPASNHRVLLIEDILLTWGKASPAAALNALTTLPSHAYHQSTHVRLLAEQTKASSEAKAVAPQELTHDTPH